MIKKIFFIVLTLAICIPIAAARKKTAKKAVFPVSVTELKTERMVNPMSIDTSTPRLGWIITSQKNDVLQTSCRIIVASTEEKAQALDGDLWDTTINGSKSQWISYAGKTLKSNTRCYWRVKCYIK